MTDEKKSFWRKPWKSARALCLFWLLVVFPALFVILFAIRLTAPSGRTPAAALQALAIAGILSIATLPIALLLRYPRRFIFVTACVLSLLALFYAEENWRGKRAYERSKRELQAKGVELNWDKFIPPPVPDDLNVFKAPKMQEWFVKNDRLASSDGSINLTSSNELSAQLQTPPNFPLWGGSKTIDSDSDARAYLTWSDGLQPQFTLIRKALKRPYARMDGDYSHLLTLPFPNVAVIREAARVLAQRVHCHLLLHEPEKAIEDVTLIHDLSHLLDASPTGKPVTLIAAMVNVADVGLYADVVGRGLQLRAWQEPELMELQRQLADIHALIPIIAAYDSEPAASSRALETVPMKEIANAFARGKTLYRIAPRGWIYQNLAAEAPFFYAPAGAIDVQREIVFPKVCQEYKSHLAEFTAHKSPYTALVGMVIPNLYKAMQTTARNQNLANLALAACVLERYHIANGSYPDSLAALSPKFIEKIPHDLINGGALQYRRDGDTFVLYSVGWNEKDDGGMASTQRQDGQPDLENGDWVWQYSPK